MAESDRVDDLASRMLAVEGEQRAQAREWREAVAAVKRDLADTETRLQERIGSVHTRVDAGFKHVDERLDQQDETGRTWMRQQTDVITRAIRIWPSSAYVIVGGLITLVGGMVMNGWLHIFGK